MYGGGAGAVEYGRVTPMRRVCRAAIVGCLALLVSQQVRAGQRGQGDHALAAFAHAIRNEATDGPDTLSLAVEITRLISAITAVLGPSGITKWQEVTLPAP